MKGALLDRIFNLLRDGNINKVPGTTFSAILSRVRGQNLGWRFFIDSISKLSDAGEAEEHFFLKSLSIVQGYLKSTLTLDLALLSLILEQFLITQFENQSTVVRKQVVLTLAEL